MKIALVTTTITPPDVLDEYRMCDASVPFIVAGDQGVDDKAIRDLCSRVGGTRYLSYDEQAGLGYAVHQIIGPCCIQRRNIAILEAIKGGADIVVTIDTDNHPNVGYFDRIREIQRLGGYPQERKSGWLNPGDWAIDADRYVIRGFPNSQRRPGHEYHYQDWNWSGNVGILEGLVLGDPDIGAMDRIVNAPWVGEYRDVPIIISPRKTWSPINSQNTAYVRELTPLMGLPPGIGRYDDVFGSYIAQRVLMDTDYRVAFGQPFVRQERHPHNLINDLKQELFGMEFTEAFCDDLKAMDLSGESTILGKLGLVYDGIARLDYMPEVVAQFGRAWCADVAGVLS